MPSPSTQTKSYSPDVQNIIDSLKRRVTELEHENEDLSTEIIKLEAAGEAILPVLPGNIDPSLITGRSAELFRLLASRKGHTFRKAGIFSMVWGSEGSDKSVDVHIVKLRKKLDETKAPFHIETVWGEGYALKDGPDPNSDRRSRRRLKVAEFAPADPQDIEALTALGFAGTWNRKQAKVLRVMAENRVPMTSKEIYRRAQVPVTSFVHYWSPMSKRLANLGYRIKNAGTRKLGQYYLAKEPT